MGKRKTVNEARLYTDKGDMRCHQQFPNEKWQCRREEDHRGACMMVQLPETKAKKDSQ